MVRAKSRRAAAASRREETKEEVAPTRRSARTRRGKKTKPPNQQLIVPFLKQKQASEEQPSSEGAQEEEESKHDVRPRKTKRKRTKPPAGGEDGQNAQDVGESDASGGEPKNSKAKSTKKPSKRSKRKRQVPSEEEDEQDTKEDTGVPGNETRKSKGKLASKASKRSKNKSPNASVQESAYDDRDEDDEDEPDTQDSKLPSQPQQDKDDSIFSKDVVSIDTSGVDKLAAACDKAQPVPVDGVADTVTRGNIDSRFIDKSKTPELSSQEHSPGQVEYTITPASPKTQPQQVVAHVEQGDLKAPNQAVSDYRQQADNTVDRRIRQSPSKAESSLIAGALLTLASVAVAAPGSDEGNEPTVAKSEEDGAATVQQEPEKIENGVGEADQEKNVEDGAVSTRQPEEPASMQLDTSDLRTTGPIKPDSPHIDKDKSREENQEQQAEGELNVTSLTLAEASHQDTKGDTASTGVEQQGSGELNIVKKGESSNLLKQEEEQKEVDKATKPARPQPEGVESGKPEESKLVEPYEHVEMDVSKGATEENPTKGENIDSHKKPPEDSTQEKALELNRSQPISEEGTTPINKAVAHGVYDIKSGDALETSTRSKEGGEASVGEIIVSDTPEDAKDLAATRTRSSTTNGEKEGELKLIQGHAPSTESSSLNINGPQLPPSEKMPAADMHENLVSDTVGVESKDQSSHTDETGEEIVEWKVESTDARLAADLSSTERGTKRKRDAQSDHDEMAVEDEPLQESKKLESSIRPENGNTLKASEEGAKMEGNGGSDHVTAISDSPEKGPKGPQHEPSFPKDFLSIQASLPNLDRLKLRLYVAGTRVHRGRGAERRFADYWDALTRYITVQVHGSQSNANKCLEDARDALDSFLATKQLRKLHNGLILAIMKRCLQQYVPDNDLQQHIPEQWRRKTKRHRITPGNAQSTEASTLRTVSRVKPSFQMVSGELESWSSEFGANSDTWSAGGIGAKAPYGLPISDLSDKGLPTSIPSSSELSSCLPGALTVERLVKRIGRKQGIGLASNTAWLLVIAVREYTSAILKNTISSIDALSHDQILPPPLLSLPVTHSTKGSQKKTAGRKTTASSITESAASAIVNPAVTLQRQQPLGDKKERCITPLDIAMFLSSTASTASSSLGGSTSRLAFERCLASSFRTSPSGQGPEFDAVNNFIASEIKVMPEVETSIFTPQKPDKDSVVAPNIPQPSSISRRTSRGLGRGAKNLAALRARSVAKSSPQPSSSATPGDAVSSANSLNEAPIQDAVRESASEGPPDVDPSAAPVPPLSSVELTQDSNTTEPTPAVGEQTTMRENSGQMPIDSPSTKGGRGVGSKNLAAIRARSITKMSSGVEDEVKPVVGLAGTDAVPTKPSDPQSRTEVAVRQAPSQKNTGRAEASNQSSPMGGKELTMLKMAEERRKSHIEETNTNVKSNAGGVSEHVIAENNGEHALPGSQAPVAEEPKPLAPVVQVHDNPDGAS